MAQARFEDDPQNVWAVVVSNDLQLRKNTAMILALYDALGLDFVFNPETQRWSVVELPDPQPPGEAPSPIGETPST